MPHRGDGPIPAKLMLVGEAWGKDEDDLGKPFVGYSGQELNRMLHEAGIMRSECFVTNVVNHRPPNNNLKEWIAFTKKAFNEAPKGTYVDWRGWKVKPIVVEGHRQLLAEIEMVQPNVIVAFGNLSLFALTQNTIKMGVKGPSGILKWRGSQLRMEGGDHMPKVIPTIHPAAVQREWSFRATVLNDLRRIKRHMNDRTYVKPAWNFTLRPTFPQVMQTLHWLKGQLDAGLLQWLELDLETRGGHISTCGISWTRVNAISIPFMCVERSDGYWPPEEESHIIYLLWKVLRHPKAKVRWQNGLYDAQYTYRHWHFVPNHEQDTMISQHMLWSDQPKRLDYQASMFCDWYVYWKDEGKNWDPRTTPEDVHWNYNCQDCVYTREAGEVELQIIDTYMERGSWPQAREIHNFQQAMFWPVLKAMQRGVRIIPENRNHLAMEVQEQIEHRKHLLFHMLGHDLNPRSNGPGGQMQRLFYEDLGQPIIWKRGEKGEPSRPTLDDDALNKIALREPLLKPLVNCISDIRTLEIFLGNFILAKLDVDGRMRCSYNIGGSESGKSAPKTYRLSSSTNAFGSGTNLQNIPSEKSKSVGKAEKRGHLAMLGDPYSLPNVRSLFGPDPGYTFFDLDLDRSDLQVVVWEVDDQMLKTALRMGVDIHLLNAFVIDGREPPPLEELVETHPKYLDHRGPMKYKREFAKVFCHASNFGGGAKKIAGELGRTIHEIDRAQRIWFDAHPGIKRWHEEIKDQVFKRRYIENKFGYRWYIFDRLDSIIPEAIGWIPQSTTSIVINKIWMNLYMNLPEVEVLLQVHDSLAGQYPTHMPQLRQRILDQSKIVIPYDDPLIIPTGIGTSEVTWGEC